MRSVDGPVRVVVLGRLNTGKSTLLNALLGQRVAATAHGECTRVVTWYRYGYPECAELMMRDGSVSAVPLQDGGLPNELGVKAGDVRSISVWLSNELLRTMTLIDTPGLGSTTAEVKRATREFLLDASAPLGPVTVADAVLFVVRETVTEDEIEALRMLRERVGTGHGLAVGTIGVLTRIDQFCDLDRLHEQADALATQRASELREYANTIVPVIGLLGETAEAALLRESDVASIKTLSTISPERLDVLLASGEEFTADAPGIGIESPQRLLDLLDLFGVRESIVRYRAGNNTATRLRGALSEVSGIQRLRRTVSELAVVHVDPLRASWAMQALHDLSFAQTAGNATYLKELRAEVQRLRDSPAMHRLVELAERHAVLSGIVVLPEPWRSDFLQVTGGTSDEKRLGGSPGSDLEALSLAGVGRWRSFVAFGASPANEKLARVAVRSYTLAHARLTGSLEV
jgi:50S ribosome-binding GTPase